MTPHSWFAFDWSDTQAAERAGDFWVNQCISMARRAHDIAWDAVNDWAEQAGMSAEKWLEHWEPVIEFEYPDGMTLGYEIMIRVKAKVRQR